MGVASQEESFDRDWLLLLILLADSVLTSLRCLHFHFAVNHFVYDLWFCSHLELTLASC